MQIKIAADSLYEFLTNPPTPLNTTIDEGGRIGVFGEEDWKGGSHIFRMNCSTSGANLPRPFFKVGIKLDREGNYYSGGLSFFSQAPEFHQLPLWRQRISPGLVRTYNNYFAMPHGGYLLDDKKEPVIAIDATSSSLIVCTGSSGIRRRPMSNESDFLADMATIERVGNAILLSGYGRKRQLDLVLTLDL